MKNTLISVAAVVIAVVALFGGKTVTVVQERLGASPGPSRSNPCEVINGVQHCYHSQRMNQASTTVCSFRNTQGATSTVKVADASLVVGTTTATFWEWGKASVSDATTTSLGKGPLAGGAQATIVASTSAGHFAGGGTFFDGATVLAPNDFINLKYGGPLGSLNVFQGSCDIEVVTPVVNS